MSALDPFILACKSRGLDVKYFDDVFSKSEGKTNGKDNVYVIQNSKTMSRRSAAEIIKSLNYLPLFSQNRPDQKLAFTFVPNKIDERFKKVKCSHLALTKDELQKAIETTSNRVNDNGPITILGRELFSSFSIAKNEMVKTCTGISTLTLEFLDNSKPGFAIDLGCGRGSNSIFLLERGWKVVAIDNNHEGLELFRKDIIGKNYIESGQLTLIEDDIVTCKLPVEKEFDLALCVDVLPYINSKHLLSLVKKIHATLIPNGRFIGTLFVSNPNIDKIFQELMEKMGAHFYPGNHIAPSLLEHSGFEILDCSLRQELEETPDTAVQFDVKKQPLNS